MRRPKLSTRKFSAWKKKKKKNKRLEHTTSIMTLNLKEGEAANEVNPTEKKSILNHWTAIDK